MIVLYHTKYSRYQALEIIWEHTFQQCIAEGDTNKEAADTANKLHKFYVGRSNKVLEGHLEDISGTRPVVI